MVAQLATSISIAAGDFRAVAAHIVLDPVDVATSGDRLPRRRRGRGAADAGSPCASLITPTCRNAPAACRAGGDERSRRSSARAGYAFAGVQGGADQGGTGRAREHRRSLIDAERTSHCLRRASRRKNYNPTAPGCSLSSAIGRGPRARARHGSLRAQLPRHGNHPPRSRRRIVRRRPRPARSNISTSFISPLLFSRVVPGERVDTHTPEVCVSRVCATLSIDRVTRGLGQGVRPGRFARAGSQPGPRLSP